MKTEGRGRLVAQQNLDELRKELARRKRSKGVEAYIQHSLRGFLERHGRRKTRWHYDERDAFLDLLHSWWLKPADRKMYQERRRRWKDRGFNTQEWLYGKVDPTGEYRGRLTPERLMAKIWSYQRPAITDLGAGLTPYRLPIRAEIRTLGDRLIILH